MYEQVNGQVRTLAFFSKWLYQERNKRGLSVHELFTRTGISRTLLYSLEKRHRVATWITVYLLLEVFEYEILEDTEHFVVFREKRDETDC